MVKNKLFYIEISVLVLLLVLSNWGFWYFEESLILRILVTILSVSSVFYIFFKKEEEFKSKYEFLCLLVLYLSSFSLYNFLYGQNLPLYIVMVALFFLVSVISYFLFTTFKDKNLIAKENLNFFIILITLVILEIFLSLSFWPINPETKSLLIVLFFYLATSLIYLHMHSMLRLKRIVGYLIAIILIFMITILFTWLEFTR